MYAVLSDIHGNMYALQSVAADMAKQNIEGIILLGDLIDYGMQSNEVVDYVRSHWSGLIICNIWGNHEKAIMTSDFGSFSYERGVNCAKHTRALLSEESIAYLNKEPVRDGLLELELEGKRVLAVHGSLQEPYWKAICPEDERGDYSGYDLVISGHSHISHFFFKSYEREDPLRRNKHQVCFLNPGSVGQPRNHNPAAQYALLDMKNMSVTLRAVEYDVKAAMRLYDGSVDEFYRNRLEYGV